MDNHVLRFYEQQAMSNVMLRLDISTFESNAKPGMLADPFAQHCRHSSANHLNRKGHADIRGSKSEPEHVDSHMTCLE
jgi:hypothetical protein